MTADGMLAGVVAIHYPSVGPASSQRVMQSVFCEGRWFVSH